MSDTTGTVIAILLGSARREHGRLSTKARKTAADTARIAELAERIGVFEEVIDAAAELRQISSGQPVYRTPDPVHPEPVPARPSRPRSVPAAPAVADAVAQADEVQAERAAEPDEQADEPTPDPADFPVTAEPDIARTTEAADESAVDGDPAERLAAAGRRTRAFGRPAAVPSP